MDFGIVGQGERSLALLVDAISQTGNNPPDELIENIPGKRLFQLKCLQFYRPCLEKQQ